MKRSLVPAIAWLRAYPHDWLRPDVVAGLITAAVVIPKAMAYATIAGLPLQVGLYTAFLPMVVYALLGTSRMLSVSTTTTIAILGASALGELATTNPGTNPVTATATLALMVGAILLVARVLRLGFVANFISDPVLTGFKAGIGLVIVVDQVPKLLGIHIHKEGFLRDIVSIAGHVPEASIPTLAVAVGTFVLIGVFEKFVPKAPTPLIAVAGGIIASALLGLKAQGVSIVGAIPGGFPSLTLPDLSLAATLWPAAAGIALMSFTETIAAGKAFARPDDPRTDSNQELVGIGAANAIGGLFGAMPSGGGTSQTAVNLKAGARTQAAEFVTAAMTVATMLFLAPVMGAMPNATLAAIVIAYSIGLISPQEIAAIRRIRVYEFRWAIAAFAGVVLLGTLKGILVAVLVSMASLMHQANNPRVYALGRKKGTHVFRQRSGEHPDDETFPGLLIARPEGRFYFGNAQAIGEKMRALWEEDRPAVVLIDFSAIPSIEYTALRILVEAERQWREQGVEIWLAALNPDVLEVVRKTPLAERLGRSRMFFTVEDAVAAFEASRPNERKEPA
jgi:high affinity sulfate transporter 1